MEEKNIFVVTQETQMCGETFYSAIAAYHNEEDAKKKMKEVSKNDMTYLKEHVSTEDIDERNTNMQFISMLDLVTNIVTPRLNRQLSINMGCFVLR